MEIQTFIQWALCARLCATDWDTKMHKTQVPVWNNLQLVEKPDTKTRGNKTTLKKKYLMYLTVMGNMYLTEVGGFPITQLHF